jgi:hypothetical protein
MRAAACQAAPGASAPYERRQPEETTLYQVVQDHVETFLAQVERETGTGLPQFVKTEFEAFLECGILAHGFLRLRCGDCTHEKLVAFSCKRRGFCPACGARRMAETAAHLVEHVIPHVPVRQWVVSFPIPLRHLFATQPQLLSPVLQVIHRALATFVIHQAGLTRDQAQTGAVTLIQRFGSAANLNIHLHGLMLDGVYRLTDGVPIFQAVPAPTTEQLQAVLTRIVQRVLKSLTRTGALIEEQGLPYLANPDADPALAPLHAAACTYRIALGPRAGQKVLTWKDPALRSASPEGSHSQGCVNAQGFSLHADTRCGSQQRQKLERLCRYITRPALGHKRLSRTRAGEVVLQLKTPYRDGTTHLVMTPLEFLQRLAALVPRPRLHLIRFHGVLAPNATLRSQIVHGAANSETDIANRNDDLPAASLRARMNWAQLLKRVFAIDLTTCPQCGGPLTILAAIEDPAVIVKILTHLGLPTRAPPRAPAHLDAFFHTA